MLRRHDVKGGVNRILEYHGPGLAGLSAMDRHVIANMGAELGATTTVFPSDDAVRDFLIAEDRGDDWTELVADEGAQYDIDEVVDLSALEPLIAKPSSPGNVVPVSEVAGEPVAQVVIGSSANPGLRDFAIAAAMVRGHQTSPDVSFDVNPTSREILTDLTRMGATTELVINGARIHQAGCMGCIGMGQAPATGRNSLRTMPRNFPAGPAPRRIRCGCARRKPLRHRRSQVSSPIRGNGPPTTASSIRNWICPPTSASTPPCWSPRARPSRR